MRKSDAVNAAATEKSLSALLFYFDDVQLQQELEQFRVVYEARFQRTDLTKRYTSTWPTDQQEWLLKNEPLRYFEGLPPFVQAFIKEKMNEARVDGALDDMPPPLIELYVKGQLRVNGEGRSR